MSELILPSQLALAEKPEQTFHQIFGNFSAEYVMGVLALFCLNNNANSFEQIELGRFYPFLLNYSTKFGLERLQKHRGLQWLLDRQIINLEKSKLVIPDATMAIMGNFRPQQQNHSTLSAHL